jgi:hypothetical protein
MRTPSKRMSVAPKSKVKIWAYPILALLLVGVGVFLYRHPYYVFALLACGIITVLGTISDRRYRRQLAASRLGEGICTFVRGFDCRQTDTWILRAVYEELSRFLAVDDRAVPIRADDQCCKKDLKIDPEDLDYVALNIAFRARRSMKNTKQNPFYGRVKTVRDLVSFFESQPTATEVEPVA